MLKKMKVLTWNLGFWQHKSNHERAWAYLREQVAPDLALLQEVSTVRPQSGENIFFRQIHQNWGTALYAQNLTLEPFTLETNQPNRVVAAVLRIQDNQDIIAMSIHAPIVKGYVFPHLNEIFDRIEKAISGKTFIVGGDLNTARLAEKVWPNHGHGQFFERLSKSIFFDCFRKFHVFEEQTYFRKNSKWPFQDDHLFVSHDLADRVKSCYVLNNDFIRSLSDHIQVVAEIDI
jgi:exonuclease III